MDEKFVEAPDCLRSGMCSAVGACIVASTIENERQAKMAGRKGEALEMAIDEKLYPCSHPQAVQARKENKV